MSESILVSKREAAKLCAEAALSENILVSKAETARLLGVSARTVDNLVIAGELRVRKIGRRSLFSRRELENFARRDHPTRAPSAAKVDGDGR